MRQFNGTNVERGWIALSSRLDNTALQEEEWEEVRKDEVDSDP